MRPQLAWYFASKLQWGVEPAYGYNNSIGIIGRWLRPVSVSESVVFHADRLQLGRDGRHDQPHVLGHGGRLRRRQFVYGLLRGPLSSSHGGPREVRTRE